MKILITTDTYSPVINGVVTSIHNLHRELKRAGHDVRILTLSHMGDEYADGDVYGLKSWPCGVYPDARMKHPLRNRFVKEVIQWRPDIIHSQTEFSMMLVAKYIAYRLNIPHVHTYHTMYENYLDYVFGGKLITKRMSARMTQYMLNHLDRTIVATDKTKQALLSYGVNTPIVIVPTGLDVGRFEQEMPPDKRRELMARLQLDAEDRIMAYVGRIAEEKNIHELISFLPDVRERVPPIKLLIVGDGPSLVQLRQQAESSGLQNSVIFAGMVAQDEVHHYYQLADLFVHASTSETQGLTYLEALCSGCPVVCRYDPCIDGVVEHGKNGYTYRDQAQFTSYVSEIIADPALRERMGRAGRMKAALYSSTSFAEQVVEQYWHTLINAKQTRRWQEVVRPYFIRAKKDERL